MGPGWGLHAAGPWPGPAANQPRPCRLACHPFDVSGTRRQVGTIWNTAPGAPHLTPRRAATCAARSNPPDVVAARPIGKGCPVCSRGLRMQAMYQTRGSRIAAWGAQENVRPRVRFGPRPQAPASTPWSEDLPRGRGCPLGPKHCDQDQQIGVTFVPRMQSALAASRRRFGMSRSRVVPSKKPGKGKPRATGSYARCPSTLACRKLKLIT